MLHHLLLRARRESFAEATVRDRPRHRTAWSLLPQLVYSEIYLAQGPRAEEDFRGHHRSRFLETTSMLGEVLGD